MSVRSEAYERRMRVLEELTDIAAVPHVDTAGAYHVRYFHGAFSRCWGLPQETIGNDLRWLWREGYVCRVRKAEYVPTAAGLAAVDQRRGQR